MARLTTPVDLCRANVVDHEGLGNLRLPFSDLHCPIANRFVLSVSNPLEDGQMKRWILLAIALVVGCRARVPSEDLTKVTAEDTEANQLGESCANHFPPGTECDLARVAAALETYNSGNTGAPKSEDLDIQFLQDQFASSMSSFSGFDVPSPGPHLSIEFRSEPRQESDVACMMCGRVHEPPEVVVHARF